MSAESSANPPCPERVGNRYKVLGALGRGGMAVVYRVLDETTGRQVALKQLALAPEAKHRRETAALFEREFHTLAQLSHPRVVEVYEYGIDDANPYYTMELLDGGDLRERSPLPWRDACALFYDVCSSLALLHSRRLIHRDVSPRNVRCTKEGSAKLIDFGAMAPMGQGGQVVGTPAFVAPEVVHHSMLDARTDLFSLGATLYFALTGRSAYRARDFAQLLQSWTIKPPPPSTFVPGIPTALDGLVMSLISLEPVLRPPNAFEVMQRLCSIAGIERTESLDVSRAYLSTPIIVGRDELLAIIRAAIAGALRRRGGTIWIHGSPGLGRSRMLDASALEAQTLGATVLRAHASAAASGDLAAAQQLADQLVEALPDVARECARGLKEDPVLSALFEPHSDGDMAQGRRPQLRRFADLGATRPALQAALARWLVDVCKRQALVIAVDDVHRVDEPSVALLAALADKAERQQLLVMVAAEQVAGDDAPAALRLLSNRARGVALSALSREQTGLLLRSMFGDVPHVDPLSERIHATAAGNPGEAIELAQHLVEKGLIKYEDGSWTLPSELADEELPASAEAVFRARVAALQPMARFIARAQSLSLQDGFTREDYARLAASAEPQRVDQAITELVSQRVLASDGRSYTLVHRGWAALFDEDASEAERAQSHRALAELHDGAHKTPFVAAHHYLAAGLADQAVDRLASFVRAADELDLSDIDEPGMKLEQIAPIAVRALDAAQAHGRAPREIFALTRLVTLASTMADDEYYWRGAPTWLARLERDSGLDVWRELASEPDPGQRLMRAFQAASERHAATPEAERVYRPDEAIKMLVQYVVVSIAVGARTLDARLIASLPALLEPFAPISQVIEAIRQNAIATYDLACHGRLEAARTRWIDLYARLGNVSAAELRFAERIRDAMAFGIGSIEASLGLLSAMRWADCLDRDPMQAVNAMMLRKVVRLQQGDWEGAERFRRKAEVLAVQANARQMFTGSLIAELGAHALAGDLTGVKHVADRIERLAERSPAWLVYQHLAEALSQLLRGNAAAAEKALERCFELTSSDPENFERPIFAWPRVMAAWIETLLRLERYEEAQTTGEAAMARCAELGFGFSSMEIARALSLADAKLGQYPRAAERLEGVIALQLQFGVTGLNLGASYEARARIAIWAGDHPAVERYAALTAEEYRHGRGSPLGARYERLMEEALRAGVPLLPELSKFEVTLLAPTQLGGSTRHRVDVAALLQGVPAEEVASQALTLVCEARGATAGHLYLTSEAGLRLAASYGPVQPEDSLLSYVSEYFARELEDQESATSVIAGGAAVEVQTATAWTDACGLSYEPVPITSVVAGERVYAGVAVLCANARTRRQPDLKFVTEVGGYLLHAGLAQAVHAGN